jgi:signal transduction histidine kinase/DNA-binding response OmpR family regulator
MFPVEHKTAQGLYVAIAISMAIVFVIDLYTPLGIAVWVIYFVPLTLSFFTWRPLIPVALAVLASILMAIDFAIDPNPVGISPKLAGINRGFDILTVWIVAGAGHLFIRSKLAVRKEEWLQAGQVGLTEKMSGELRLEQLGENVLRFLAEYLDAQAGAFFVENGDAFRRCGAYATPADAGTPELFRPGDGLLGQAVKDGRGFLIHDVPEGYLYFGSSLGQSRPRHLLIAPVKADGAVNAVLELGFIEKAGAAHTELLERVSQSIGVAVRSAKYRFRLQELLEETQSQAEELQAQSEELRETNVELEEQSRALKESQTRLEIQQHELEQTNAHLEEQTQLLEAQRDDLSGAQGALQAQAQALERASRYKSEFLANMSHELRTPLNSSLILARLLADNREGNLTPEQVKYAENILSSGNDLLALINDILDLSKIEAGRVEAHIEKALISQLVEKLRRTFQPIAEQKGLEFRTQVAPGAPEEAQTDPLRLEQVLKNLLSNALKFTEKGEVVLEVSRAAEGRLAFSVRDTGIGIPEEQQQVIFEAFRQADGTTNRRYGGTGLGLSISRELAGLLGGEIRVRSEVGRGSVFTVTIPEVYDATLVPLRQSDVVAGVVGDAPPVAAESALPSISAPAASRAGADAPSAPVKPRHVEDDRERLAGDSRVILIVEDDAIFARILRDLAHELGFQCLIAETADEGVTVARQYLPNAVILDILLPDHSGLSVLDMLKHDVLTRHIPVHIISVTDYMQTALSYGAAGYLLKPAPREELVQALTGLEKKLTRRMRKVLVVENDLVQLDAVRRLIASREVETAGARSAAECLEKLKATTFDCMVLDLSLPDMSGFNLLERLSRDDAYAFPPVIIYTGRDLTPDEELRLRRRSKSIIIKGAKSPERLLDEVTLFLHQVVSDLPDEQRKMIEKSLSRDAALEGKRILVVEDDVRNVFALTSVLEPRGAIVQIARNGREALQALERSAQGGVPPIDLVLMDMMMPEMDGLTATREIRKHHRLKNLPVIALTAKAMKNDQEQCLEAGANDYMAKPLDVEKLLSLVRVWMPR